jgi:hypothetical protein
MKNENLNEISTDDLKKKEKVTRLITSGLLECCYCLYYQFILP